MLQQSSNVNTGRQAAPFSLADPDGRIHTLNDLFGEQGLVIAFICNHCPYVRAVMPRLVDDARDLKEMGVNLVGINSNDYRLVPEDSPARMKDFIRDHGIDFPYLVDEDQSVATTYEAVCTPDFFGFDKQGKLRYRGRLDNGRLSSPPNRVPELVDAMKEVIATGQGPTTQHPSMGCSIKWGFEGY